jgi:hypothetical protein
MPAGEEGPVATGTRARVKERRRTAIDLTGAVIGFICEARIYGEHEVWSPTEDKYRDPIGYFTSACLSLEAGQ